MTRPDARSCHQTNFSEGGFVRKGLFFYFSFFFDVFCLSLFPFPLFFFFKVTLASWMSIFQGVSRQLDVHLIIHERGDAENDSLVM